MAAGGWITTLFSFTVFGVISHHANGAIAGIHERALEADTGVAEEASCLLQRDRSHRVPHADVVANAVATTIAHEDHQGKMEAKAHMALTVETSLEGKSNEHTGGSSKQAALLLATEAKGLFEAGGLDYSAANKPHDHNYYNHSADDKMDKDSEADLVQVLKFEDGEGSTTTTTTFHKRSKTVLAVLEFVPLFWILGIDRLYLGNTSMGILKFVLSLCTCGAAGVIWGLIDLFIVILSCLRKDLVLNCFGMHAVFEPGQVEPAFVIILIELASIPFIIMLVKFVLWWRAENRRRLLAENALKSPDYGRNHGEITSARGMVDSAQ
mmetsp:Transcript_1118/g.2466  ORF Transcript_1118/g.2466 Transcript_1118/m.2466 type:complete len:324 (+) Transcript_1118:138-1109(+)